MTSAVRGGAILRKTLTEVFLSNANPYTYAHDGDDVILSIAWNRPGYDCWHWGEADSGTYVRFNGVVILKIYAKVDVACPIARVYGSGKEIVPLIGLAAGNYVVDSVGYGPRGQPASITTYRYERT